VPNDDLVTELTIFGTVTVVRTSRKAGQPARGPAHQRAHTAAVKEAVDRLYAQGRERSAQAAYDAVMASKRWGRHPMTGVRYAPRDLAPMIRDMILRRKFTPAPTGHGPAYARKPWPKTGVPADPAAAGRALATDDDYLTFEEI